MVHKKIKSNKNEETFYIPVDVTNCADHIHVTDSNPGRMKGYGGSPLIFDMEDGTKETVVGPWHTNSGQFLEHTGINVGELHRTRVTLWNDRDEVIYEEPGMVLGPFYRGDRIAEQLAAVTGKPIRVKVDTAGGGHSHTHQPFDEGHPLSRRKEER